VPERPWLVDRYGDHILVSEFVTPIGRQLDTGAREAERDEVLSAVTEVLGVPAERIHLKTRERHRSLEREAQGDPAHEIVVEERGHKFLVNLDDYLDTGLFLDHRNARRRVGERSAGQRVLNLFCYTGAFSVYAAKGGAVSTVSVDLSATYLAWAQRNLALNGVALPRHSCVRSDVVEYLRQTSDVFDTIVLDPPTISKSKQARSFDVQRDHVTLIQLALARLAPGGLLLFSTNYRQFSLDASAFRKRDVREITHETVPKDFREGIHRAWELR
jgi:23S rRNA G2069 N7-methylase RlmK/C1962 C5-methylase RlmI